MMKTRRIGIISDTHGLLRPAAVEALRGVEQIIHAGDVGKAEVLEALREIAPTTAVRGNVDTGLWAQSLHYTEVVDLDDTLVYVLHDRSALELDPGAAGFQVVVSGHSHRAGWEEKGGVYYLNPGSAGPRRFALSANMAILTLDGEQPQVEFIDLDPD